MEKISLDVSIEDLVSDRAKLGDYIPETISVDAGNIEYA